MMVDEKPIRLTWLPLLKDKLWYQHIFVYKLWRQTRTSVYWCAQDIRQYGGTERTPKQRRTCRLAGNQGALPGVLHNWQPHQEQQEFDKSKDVCQTHFRYDLKYEGKQRKPHISRLSFEHFKSFLQFDMEHFLSMRGDLHDVIWTSRHLSYFLWSRFSSSCSDSDPLLLHHLLLLQVSRLDTLRPPPSRPTVSSGPCSASFSAQLLPPTFLPSISPQQITICLQALGRTPQLFWLQLQIYLYQTMQRAGVSDLRLGSPSVYPTVWLPELNTR